MKITYNGIELDVEKAEIIAWSAEPPEVIADKTSESAEDMHLHFSSVDEPTPDGRCRVRLTLRKKEQ